MPIIYPQRDLYNRQDTRIEYQIFNQEYFSGADMHIYFGDIWVDEITNLEFSLQEEILPIYGYHSYTFDTVARGKRIIQGNFSINFTSVGYLQQIIDNAEAIEFALKGDNGKTVDPKFYENYRLDEILRMFGKESFEQIAQEYEDAIWGSEQKFNDAYLASPRAPYFQQGNPYGFEIRINYGPVSETYQHESYYSSQKTATKPHLTVETINGVQITGLQKSAGTSNQGAPVQETYSFIARDINGAFIKG